MGVEEQENCEGSSLRTARFFIARLLRMGSE